MISRWYKKSLTKVKNKELGYHVDYEQKGHKLYFVVKKFNGEILLKDIIGADITTKIKELNRKLRIQKDYSNKLKLF